CSDVFIDELVKVAEKETYKAGDTILKEGARTERLLILSSGIVDVIVNGEKVAHLQEPGSLMGEISVLAGRPATATIIARTDVTLIRVAAPALDKALNQPSRDFGFELYWLFATVLANKMTNTNEKARQFEIANRSLLEINRTLDQKVQERTEATFKRLSDLQKALAAKDLDLALETLKPISEMFSTERAIRSRRVLVAEPDRKQQTIARMALGGTGARLEMATNPDEVTAALEASAASNTSPELIFVSSELAPELAKIRTLAPKAKIVYMAGNELSTSIESLKQSAPLLSNIVSRHSEDRNFTVKNMATTVTKLVSNDLFGLEKYMMWGVEAQSCPITSSSERAALLEKMQEHLASLGVRSKITDRAASVGEELLMNAIYDAPLKNGEHCYAHLPRTTAVELSKEEHGEFRFACDGMLAAISVSDPFGAFRMQTLLDYLERNAKSKGES
ncbi:MAG: cyclic nucleotide-binding domain-containing protein, partial [Proteobacteria bacterium]